MFESLIVLGIRSGKLYRVSTAGGSAEPIEGAGSYPDGVVVDGDTVYWTTMGSPERNREVRGEAGFDFSARNGGVHAVGLDGSDARDVVAAGSITTGKQLTTDGAGTLYWSDREGCRVSSASVDGSQVTDLIVNEPGDSQLDQCVGVAVDPTAGFVYWSQKGPAKGGQGRILRAGLSLPPGETAATRSDVEILWDGLPEPIDLEIVGDRLYWTDRGAAPRGNTLNRAPLPAPGDKGSEIEILADGFAEAIGLAVDEDAGVAYVSDLGGRIWVVPLQGSSTKRVLIDLGEPLTGIAGVSS
jgi:sugar lactone lactonase YvrE